MAYTHAYKEASTKGNDMTEFKGTKMRSETHKAKMAAKKARVQEVGFTPIAGKLSRALVARWQINHPGQSLPILPSVRRYDLQRVKPAASINRHTGNPHEHRREIARNLGRAA